MSVPIIGLMGPGSSATAEDCSLAFALGALIAGEGWILLSGGMGSGVMDAANRGAFEKGGITLGILPGGDRSGMSKYVSIPVVTGMGSARNNINVLSSDVVVACGMGPGTASEVALAIKAGRSVVLLGWEEKGIDFFSRFKGDIRSSGSPESAILEIKSILKTKK